ncbi:hypothetical protein MTO96_005341 [Rhipicephalus appendiculatus]
MGLWKFWGVLLREERDLGHKEEVDMVMVGLGALVAQDHGQELEMAPEMVEDLRALVDQDPGQVQVMVEAAVRGLRALADQALGLVQEMAQETVQGLRALEGQGLGQVQETVEEQEASVEQGHGQVPETAVVPSSAQDLRHGTKEDMVGTEKQVDPNHGLEQAVMVLVADLGPAAVRVATEGVQVRRDLGTAGKELALEHRGTKEDSVVAKEERLARGLEKEGLMGFLSLTLEEFLLHRALGIRDHTEEQEREVAQVAHGTAVASEEAEAHLVDPGLELEEMGKCLVGSEEEALGLREARGAGGSGPGPWDQGGYGTRKGGNGGGAVGPWDSGSKFNGAGGPLGVEMEMALAVAKVMAAAAAHGLKTAMANMEVEVQVYRGHKQCSGGTASGPWQQGGYGGQDSWAAKGGAGNGKFGNGGAGPWQGAGGGRRRWWMAG